MIGTVSYLEIGAPDARSSQTFFHQLFDWPFTPTERPGEGWFQGCGAKLGLHGDDPTPQVLVFFQVPAMPAALARLRALGGQAEEPGAAEPGFGVFCLCTDPQGVRFGLHQLAAP